MSKLAGDIAAASCCAVGFLREVCENVPNRCPSIAPAQTKLSRRTSATTRLLPPVRNDAVLRLLGVLLLLFIGLSFSFVHTSARCGHSLSSHKTVLIETPLRISAEKLGFMYMDR